MTANNLTPTVFFGHGNPMNALSENVFSQGWEMIGNRLEPRGILMISAHWYIPGTAVTTGTTPATIHDFGGFPEALYRIRYPAPGDPALAARVRDLLAPVSVEPNESRGLDHGVWSVLRHAFPRADIPVVQLSIDERQPPEFHYEFGKRLAPLREEGVLIAGSGNIVHNLHSYAWGREGVEPFDWAVRFERRVRELLRSGDHAPLVAYPSLGQDAALSVPTPEHYLPLLYVIAAARQGEKVHFPVEGLDGGSVSMLSVQIG